MDDEQSTAVELLPVLPWTLAALSLVLLVALVVPPGGPREATLRSGPSPVARLPAALLAAGLAVLAVLGARLGPASAPDSLAALAVVGLGWPLLLLVPLLGRPARRVLAPPAAVDPADVRPAALAAAGVVALLVLPADSARPETVGTAVAAYLLAAVVVGVARGRRALAARAEVLGLLARWVALGPDLVRWAPPRGAGAVLAVVLGGAWAERYERTAAWQQGLPDRTATAALLLAAVLAAAVGAALLHRVAGAAGAAALLPLAVTTAVAGVLRRALISVQLVADRAALDPDPLGVVGGQAVALGLVALGGALGGVVLARRLGEGAARLPGVGVLLVLSGVSAVVVLQA